MRLLRPLAAAALLTLGVTAQASADIIFFTGPGFIQPSENLLLSTGSTGPVVFGITNQTGTMFSITGNEILTLPSNGQADIEAADGLFTSATFSPVNPLLFFTQFEANVDVTGRPTISVVTVESNGVQKENTYIGGPGQNYFGINAINGQLIHTVTISTEPEETIQGIRQVRVGGVTPENFTPVPEPASMLLMGTGLAALGSRLRRRRG